MGIRNDEFVVEVLPQITSKDSAFGHLREMMLKYKKMAVWLAARLDTAGFFFLDFFVSHCN